MTVKQKELNNLTIAQLDWANHGHETILCCNFIVLACITQGGEQLILIITFSSHSLLPPSLALGLVLHNGVNLSYTAGTSVT